MSEHDNEQFDNAARDLKEARKADQITFKYVDRIITRRAGITAGNKFLKAAQKKCDGLLQQNQHTDRLHEEDVRKQAEDQERQQ